MAKQWTADAVLELARGFQEAAVITAAADLDVFSALAKGPATARAVASAVAANPRAAAALLDALAAMLLIAKRGDKYIVPADVARLLTEGGPASALAMVRHSGSCMRRWAQLAWVVKTGRPAPGCRSIRNDPADRAAFIEAMDEISRRVAPGLIADLGPPRFRHLLDVGGASGTWAIAFLRAVPGATATLFDLPAVIPMARRRIAEAGMSGRIRLVAGDFARDKLPRGADLAWVSAIVHQESLAGVRALFRKVYAALVPGGRILVRDIVMDSSRTRPPMGALFAINMLVATDAGGTYTFGELSDALKAAGFIRPRLLRRADDMTAIVGAQKAR